MKLEQLLDSSIRHEEKNTEMLNLFAKTMRYQSGVNPSQIGQKASQSLVFSLESALKDIKSLYGDQIFNNKKIQK